MLTKQVGSKAQDYLPHKLGMKRAIIIPAQVFNYQQMPKLIHKRNSFYHKNTSTVTVVTLNKHYQR